MVQYDTNETPLTNDPTFQLLSSEACIYDSILSHSTNFVLIHSSLVMFHLKIIGAELLKALGTLPEDPGTIPSTHKTNHKHL